MFKQAKIVFTLTVFFLASLLLGVEFSDAQVFAVKPLGNNGFSIKFELDESIYTTLAPGDLIEIKEIGLLSAHRRHIYSPTKFPTPENPKVRITTVANHRPVYRRLSEKLSQAKKEDVYKLSVLKTELSKKLLSGPVVMIAGGWAVTRAIGIAKFLEPIEHEFIIIHTRKKGKPNFHKAFLADLKEKGKYKPYKTTVGIPRIHISRGDIPSLIALAVQQYGANANYVLSGPDASVDGPGSFETALSQELQNQGIVESQIFLSTWHN